MKICCKYSSKNKNKIVEAISQKAGEKDKNTEKKKKSKDQLSRSNTGLIKYSEGIKEETGNGRKLSKTYLEKIRELNMQIENDH